MSTTVLIEKFIKKIPIGYGWYWSVLDGKLVEAAGIEFNSSSVDFIDEILCEF